MGVKLKKLNAVALEKFEQEFVAPITSEDNLPVKKPRIYPMLDVFQKDVETFEWELPNGMQLIMIGNVLDQHNNVIGKYKATKFGITYAQSFDMNFDTIVPRGKMTYHDAVTIIHGLRKEYVVKG